MEEILSGRSARGDLFKSDPVVEVHAGKFPDDRLTPPEICL